MALIEYTEADEERLARRANAVTTFVEALPITSDEELDAAGEELTRLRRAQRDLEEECKSFTKPLADVANAIRAKYRPALDAYKTATDSLSRRMGEFTREQERIAAENQRKLEAEVESRRRKAREEAEALAAKASEVDSQEERDRLRYEAESKASAVAMMDVSPAVAAPAAISSAQKTKRIKAEVTDLGALVKHVAEHPELLHLLKEDMTRINAMARALGVNMKVPGIRVTEELTYGAARKR